MEITKHKAGSFCTSVLRTRDIDRAAALYNAIMTPIFFPVLRRVAETSRAKRVFKW